MSESTYSFALLSRFWERKKSLQSIPFYADEWETIESFYSAPFPMTNGLHKYRWKGAEKWHAPTRCEGRLGCIKISIARNGDQHAPDCNLLVKYYLVFILVTVKEREIERKKRNDESCCHVKMTQSFMFEFQSSTSTAGGVREALRIAETERYLLQLTHTHIHNRVNCWEMRTHCRSGICQWF